MKNHLAILLLLLSVAGGLTSCREESRLPAPKLLGSLPLITPVLSTDPEKAYFNFRRSQLSDNGLLTSTAITNRTRPVFEFTFSLDNTRDLKVKTVEVYKSFQRISDLGPRVLVGSYSSFPATVSLNSQDALAGLSRLITQPPALPYLLDIKATTPTANNAIFNNLDSILFTFEYVLEDGRRIILTPVTKKILGNTPPPANVPPRTPTVDVLANTTQINAPYSIKAVFRD